MPKSFPDSNTPGIHGKSNALITIFHWLFFASLYTLPLLKPSLNSAIVLLLTACWLSIVRFQDVWREVKSNKIIWLFCSLFLIDVVGLVQSENLTYGWRYLETKFTIFVLPILVFTSSAYLSKKNLEQLLLSFALGVATVLMLYAGFLVYATIVHKLPFNYWMMDRLTNLPIVIEYNWIFVHPSFLSTYLTFCIFLLLEKTLLKPNRPGTRLVTVTILFILVLFQFWINSRAGVFGLFVVGLLYLFRLKTRLRVAALLAGLCMVVILFTLPFTKERLVDAPLRALQRGSEVNAQDPLSWPISFRLQITQCSLEILTNYRWLTGYGTGDFRDRIRMCYQEHDFRWLITRDLDSHNEYFAQLHRHGVFGLLLFLMCLIVPFLIAVKRKFFLYAAFLSLIAISAAPETIFTSQKGVVFYSIINSLLFLYMLKNPKFERSVAEKPL